MKLSEIKQLLDTNGYVIIPNVLDKSEVAAALDQFKQWQKYGGAALETTHAKCDPHGIYKYRQVGHQPHAWYCRTRPEVIKIFKHIWDVPEKDGMIVSFDGSCYISSRCTSKDKCWTHSDQAPAAKEFMCWQGFVSLTANKERTLVVYEGSHKLHKEYFESRGLDKGPTASKNWNLIDKDYLDSISGSRRVLDVPAGALVLWDSRTFHQNQFGAPESEDRYVQYVCYFPKSHPKNTKAIEKKRQKYFLERRTTSHWPCPVRVNSLQPQTYGDQSLVIDYDSLPEINLTRYTMEIAKLI